MENAVSGIGPPQQNALAAPLSALGHRGVCTLGSPSVGSLLARCPMFSSFCRILPVGVLLLSACGGDTVAPPAPAPEPPPVQPGVPIPPGQIESAIERLHALASDIMARSEIPGMAVAVRPEERRCGN